MHIFVHSGDDSGIYEGLDKVGEIVMWTNIPVENETSCQVVKCATKLLWISDIVYDLRRWDKDIYAGICFCGRPLIDKLH